MQESRNIYTCYRNIGASKYSSGGADLQLYFKTCRMNTCVNFATTIWWTKTEWASVYSLQKRSSELPMTHRTQLCSGVFNDMRNFCIPIWACLFVLCHMTDIKQPKLKEWWRTLKLLIHGSQLSHKVLSWFGCCKDLLIRRTSCSFFCHVWWIF